MINTLYLPELREMLADENAAEMKEFCETLHPARTAEFMEGLTPSEAWSVVRHADLPTRVEIFKYFDEPMQVEIVENQDRDEAAELIEELAPDDRVDVLADVDDHIVRDLLERLPAEDRRDILRLSAYPEGTAGAVMTTEFVRLSESLTVKEALDEIGRASEEFETIYYLYIVDENGHLRGLVSARQLIASLGKPDTRLGDIMEPELVTAQVMEDQEKVADKVARLDLLAIPVVDDERRMVGIITHDDIIDVMREEAAEDAHHMGGVDPLDETYLETSLLTLSWKRGMWLTLLFFFALLTAFAIRMYDGQFGEGLIQFAWIAAFIPLVISTGGNTGNQSATLIITALSQGHIRLSDWSRVVRRELAMGLFLGTMLGLLGFLMARMFTASWYEALVIPVTLILVVIAGTLTGSLLPLLFKRLGLDPALMSNPFVAGIIDIVGIVIYMQVALLFLGNPF